MTETPKPPEDGAVAEPAARTEPTRVLPAAWQRIPKTIPHTRARTRTVVLLVLFVGLLWWYLDLYAQFVPKEQRRTGQAPVATATAPVEPTYEVPRSTTTRARSSTVRPSGGPGESGAPSSTVPGGTSGAPSESSASGSTPSGGLVIPGVGTFPLPTPGGSPSSAPATGGGAPTTTVPPG
ncbi:hypothetical protein FK268_03170 [Tsukamurella sputi]|uniref:Uncharacterized protein n=1 Tax=Tsukamurella sputi TaxID=2591848 RepID=A0A5C5RUS0_9ACTN|nr:hypothetical protein [Tsukamurella sputi]TWS26253.1 hypothetical protein FK268_03170 [Tsukamurella sputi]